MRLEQKALEETITHLERFVPYGLPVAFLSMSTSYFFQISHFKYPAKSATTTSCEQVSTLILKVHQPLVANCTKYELGTRKLEQWNIRFGQDLRPEIQFCTVFPKLSCQGNELSSRQTVIPSL